MERNLDRLLDELAQTPDVTGVLCADNQGLCLGDRGKSSNLCGEIVALAKKASMLEPGGPAPTILLESSNR